MANVCDNKFHIQCEDSNLLEKIVKKLKQVFDSSDLQQDFDYNDWCIDGFFESTWDFPMDLFEHFFDEFNDSSIYMRCLSEEYSNGIVAMNIYNEGKWRNPQYFEL